MPIPVRVTVKKDDLRVTKFGDTDRLPEFADLPIEVTYKYEVGSDGKHDIPEGYIYINGVDMRCYPRTDVWTDVGKGCEAQLKVGYEVQHADNWFVQEDRAAVREALAEKEPSRNFIQRMFSKPLIKPNPARCGNCKLFDRHTGVKELSVEMGSYCNQDHPDLWMRDTADWIAQQTTAPTVDMAEAGYCYDREMIVQNDFPRCSEWKERS